MNRVGREKSLSDYVASLGDSQKDNVLKLLKVEAVCRKFEGNTGGSAYIPPYIPEEIHNPNQQSGIAWPEDEILRVQGGLIKFKNGVFLANQGGTFVGLEVEMRTLFIPVTAPEILQVIDKYRRYGVNSRTFFRQFTDPVVTEKRQLWLAQTLEKHPNPSDPLFSTRSRESRTKELDYLKEVFPFWKQEVTNAINTRPTKKERASLEDRLREEHRLVAGATLELAQKRVGSPETESRYYMKDMSTYLSRVGSLERRAEESLVDHSQLDLLRRDWLKEAIKKAEENQGSYLKTKAVLSFVIKYAPDLGLDLSGFSGILKEATREAVQDLQEKVDSAEREAHNGFMERLMREQLMREFFGGRKRSISERELVDSYAKDVFLWARPAEYQADEMGLLKKQVEDILDRYDKIKRPVSDRIFSLILDLASNFKTFSV
ncbi:hypothetical protein HYU95_05650 [Candidatus Daviesbacteria bacterium]|nr:hypothetical protein [Candidatus Daviesbacteria bacterium]